MQHCPFPIFWVHQNNNGLDAAFSRLGFLGPESWDRLSGPCSKLLNTTKLQARRGPPFGKRRSNCAYRYLLDHLPPTHTQSPWIRPRLSLPFYCESRLLYSFFCLFSFFFPPGSTSLSRFAGRNHPISPTAFTTRSACASASKYGPLHHLIYTPTYTHFAIGKFLRPEFEFRLQSTPCHIPSLCRIIRIFLPSPKPSKKGAGTVSTTCLSQLLWLLVCSHFPLPNASETPIPIYGIRGIHDPSPGWGIPNRLVLVMPTQICGVKYPIWGWKEKKNQGISPALVPLGRSSGWLLHAISIFSHATIARVVPLAENVPSSGELAFAVADNVSLTIVQ